MTLGSNNNIPDFVVHTHRLHVHKVGKQIENGKSENSIYFISTFLLFAFSSLFSLSFHFILNLPNKKEMTDKVFKNIGKFKQVKY